jgi:hypothetical protein
VRHAAGTDDLVRDELGEVDGVGEPDPDIAGALLARRVGDRCPGGRDADQLGPAVGERSPAVPRVDRRVRLNGVDEQRRLTTRSRHLDRAAERAHDPSGHTARQAQWGTQGHDGLADAQAGRRAKGDDLRRSQPRRFQHREIRRRITADDAGVGLLPSLKRTSTDPPFAATEITWSFVKM